MKKVWMALSFVCISIAAVDAMSAPPKDVAFPKEEIRKAIDGLRTQSPVSLAPGEFVAFDTTQTVESSPAKLLAQDSFRVLSKYENESSYTFSIRHQNVQYQNGMSYPSTEDNDVTIDKKKTAGLLLWGSSAGAGSGDYYNLKRSESVLPTPDAVLKRPDCGGLKDCPSELKVQVIEFDYEDYDIYGNFVRLHYSYWGSPEVPYMSSPMKSCAVGPFRVEGYQLKATQCISLKDFSSGH